jgi:hypothetical protein
MNRLLADNLICIKKLLIGKISTAPIGSCGVHLKCAVAPRLWSAAWPPISVPAHPRNRHTQPLPVVVAHDDAGGLFFDRPRRREVAGGRHLSGRALTPDRGEIALGKI